MDQKNNYSFSITNTASKELMNIVKYISINLSNPSKAEEIIELIYKKIEDIVSFPFPYPIYHNTFVVRGELRKALAKQFLFFYSINEKEKHIFIHGIIHSKINK